MKTEKKEYTSPELTVVSFTVEHGFTNTTLDIAPKDDAPNRNVEDYNVRNGWGSSNNSFWN